MKLSNIANVIDVEHDNGRLIEVGLTTLSPHRLNVAVLFSLATGKEINLGLELMLAEFQLQFEGKVHSASDDSRNIARLFLKMLKQVKLSNRCE